MSQWLSSPGSFPQQPHSPFPGPPNQYIPPPPYRPPQNQAPPIDDLSLAFDNLARALRATAGPPEIDNFQMSLGMLMHDCSQSNIQRGKTWIFDHCTTPAHYDTLICFIIALSKSRPIFEDRLHLIYLINDVLFHSERRQEPWIKEALHPHLLALLRVAFHFMDANEKQKEKVVKIISIWDDKQYFDENKINALRTGIIIPPPPSGQHSFHIHPSQPYYNPGVPPPPPPLSRMFPGPPSSQSISPPSTHLSPQIAQIRPIAEPGPPGIPEFLPTQSSMPMQGIIRPSVPTTPNMPPIPPPVPDKKYHELPAGLMVPAVLPEDSPYTPIHAASIRLPPHRLPPTTELLEAVDRFYEGMFIIESNLEGEDERALKEKYQIDLDKDGWEIGFLDDFYMDLQDQREEALARASSDRYHQHHISSYRHRRDDRGRRWSRDRSYSMSRSRSRSSSRSHSRRHRRRHSYSDSSISRSRSRSRGRKKHRRRRDSRSRSLSLSRSRYRSHSRSRHSWRRRSRSISPRTRTRSRTRSRSVSGSLSRSRSRTRSRTRSRSRSGTKIRSRSRTRTRTRSRTRSKTRFRTRSRSISSRYSSKSRSRSRSRSRSYDQSHIHGGRKSSDYNTSRKLPQSKSYSRSRSRSPSYFSGGLGGLGYVKDREEGSRADKMISDRNVGFQILKKLGWEGAGTGLGSTSTGIAEPIKGGEIRYGEQKYLGVGHSRGEDGDIFDQYRKAKSYTYQRSEISSKDKKLAGCFRCGKPGHLARDCPIH